MTVYAALLGDQLQALPPACQALHRDYGTWQGEITVETSSNPLVRAFLRLSGLPPAVSRAEFIFESEQSSSHDIWTRQIGPHVTTSTLWPSADGLLCERLGPVQAQSRIMADQTSVQLRIIRMSVLAVPIPLSLAPQVTTHEAQENGRYAFDVHIRMPLTKGLLIRYHGWLETP